MPNLSDWSPGSVICLVFVSGIAISSVIAAIRGKRPHEVDDKDDDDQ